MGLLVGLLVPPLMMRGSFSRLPLKDGLRALVIMARSHELQLAPASAV